MGPDLTISGTLYAVLNVFSRPAAKLLNVTWSRQFCNTMFSQWLGEFFEYWVDTVTHHSLLTAASAFWHIGL